MTENVERLKLPEGTVRGLGNCGVVALAAATGIPYREVWDWFAKRKPGNWKGSTRMSERLRFLAEHDIEYEWVKMPRRMTLQTWVSLPQYQGLAKEGPVMVTTTGHVQVVHGGPYVLDQSTPEAVHIRDFKRRRKFVCEYVHLPSSNA